ncbi:hypothetical protein XELAEV_18006286mg [Xenopus laevis]|uniref:Very low-density lipoprotein receptor n=1 Tax=Xenopus laevis TaxID=8355 RepID=A0A974E0U0_XENLA|nr:hypothetical protein XELAEV_18006286mg [Xenopus laevis]
MCSSRFLGLVSFLLGLDWLLITECKVIGLPVTCLPNQFQCMDGVCIPALWRCDGDKDCPNGEDEVSCLAEKVACNGFQCKNGHCVDLAWKCDGHSDCADGSDEDQLICENTTCPSFKFHCRNRQCIAAVLVCNGQNDCTDGSDELGCPPQQCSSEEFRCGSLCLSKSLLCDGKIDCAGGLDELKERCKGQSRLRCPTDEFDCDGHCVPKAWRCDGHPDCEDQSDEKNCEVPTIELEPFLLMFNTSEIIKGDLTGERQENILIEMENITSLTGDMWSSEIFWINGEDKTIYGQSLLKERRENLKQLGKASVLSVDWIYKLIFWIDSESQTISVASLDGSKQRVIFRENISLPTSMALNPLTGFIIWCDAGESPKIEKAAMDGSLRKPLVSEDIFRPLALTLDCKHSYVYWIDSELSTISSISLDGQHRKVVFHSKELLAKPSGIAVYEERIFWSDLENQAIYSKQRRIRANITTVASIRNPAGLIILAREVQPNSLNLCLELRADCPFLCVPSAQDSEHSTRFSCLNSDSLELDHDEVVPQTDGPSLDNTKVIAQSPDKINNISRTDGPSLDNTKVIAQSPDKINHISRTVNSTVTIKQHVPYSVKWLIPVAVFFSFTLISCMIISCRRKTSCRLIHTQICEKSKKYLKPELGRTVSATYMLTDMKSEDEDEDEDK